MIAPIVNQSTNQLINYILQLADSNLILTQRNAAWCGHGPILEQDIAITNITLDLIGTTLELEPDSLGLDSVWRARGLLG